MSNYLDSGQAPVAGQWQHLAATYDGATARVLHRRDPGRQPAFTGDVGDSNTWRIGAYGSTPGGFFDGLIDDVRIYDRALGGRDPGRHDDPVRADGHAPPTPPTGLAQTGAPAARSRLELDARRPTTSA